MDRVSGGYAASNANSAAKTPDFIDPKAPLNHDRGWRIIAGELTDQQLHCATVGAKEAIEAANRKDTRRSQIKHGDPPVNILGGYKFADAPIIDLQERVKG